MYIDPQLLDDCHVLGMLDRAGLLLHRNASIGWLILVPDTDVIDWQQLDDSEHDRVVSQIRGIAAFVSDWFAADKMNVATIGNVVAQMHVHIIARHVGDACWPKPVWGHLETRRDYTASEIDAMRKALAGEHNLVPGGAC